MNNEETIQPTISGIVITYNEERKISGCLESLFKFCNEVIVVDSGSTDDTTKICESFGAKVAYKKWNGFGEQKNYALSLVSNEWVISIDADEIIPEDLADEIVNIIKSPLYDVYEVSRRSFAYGSVINFCGWSPDYVTRLFRKSLFSFTNDKVHEKVDIQSSNLGRLNYKLLHFRNENLEQAIKRMDMYSTLWAEQKINKKKGGIFKALYKSIWTFFRIYIIKLGFLDGKPGLLIASTNAMGVFLKYAKLLLLQQK